MKQQFVQTTDVSDNNATKNIFFTVTKDDVPIRNNSN